MEITVRPTYFRRQALDAFTRGAGANSHGLNPLSAAAVTFTRRYQRLVMVNHVPDGRRGVELAQGAV